MNRRLAELARRKQALIDKAALERMELAVAFRRIRSPFHLSRSVLRIGHVLKAYPMLTAGISSILVSGLAGKLLRGIGKIAKLWRLVRPLRALWPRRRRRLFW